MQAYDYNGLTSSSPQSFDMHFANYERPFLCAPLTPVQAD